MNPKKAAKLAHRSSVETGTDGSIEADSLSPKNQKPNKPLDSNPVCQVESERLNPVCQGQQIATSGTNVNGGLLGMGRPVLRPMPDIWMPHGDPHMSGLQPMFPGGPRGTPRLMGMMGTHRGIGISSMHRLPLGPSAPGSSPNAMPQKPRTLEDDMKDVEALLNKKSFREMQNSRTGEELLDIIHRPTAKETTLVSKVQIPCLL